MVQTSVSYRKGTMARYEETHYNWAGNPLRTEKHVVTIVGKPRDKYTHRFCSPDDCYAKVKVRDEKGDEYDVRCDCLSVYNTMADLDHEDFAQLRKEVVLGSCYTSDYQNSFGIDPNEVYNYCEGFGEETGWDEEKDTPEAFADYCEGMAWAA